ncbi:MAG TPA: hypothetical protein VN763_06420, partial [Saprospiraceae bacterium]|nr:hypothetical protein [Saprospiraceae bacterium]
TFDEVLDTLHVNDINLNSVATHFPTENDQFLITPNPVADKSLFLFYPDEWNNALMSYRIMNSEGKIMQQDQLSNNIQLKEDVAPSVYYFLIYDQSKLIGLRRFIVL